MPSAVTLPAAPHRHYVLVATSIMALLLLRSQQAMSCQACAPPLSMVECNFVHFSFVQAWIWQGLRSLARETSRCLLHLLKVLVPASLLRIAVKGLA